MIYVLLCFILVIQFLTLMIFKRMLVTLSSLSQLPDVLGTFAAAPKSLKK